jgi:hypothetical protein
VNVRAGSEGEISITIISGIPVISLCSLNLWVVKEDAFVTELYFLRFVIIMRMKIFYIM